MPGLRYLAIGAAFVAVAVAASEASGAVASTMVVQGYCTASRCARLHVVDGSRQARRSGLVGHSVALNLIGARLKGPDRSGDGIVDASDLENGDELVVRAQVPRRRSQALRVQRATNRGPWLSLEVDFS
jgi:hypothetical protein